MIKKTCSIAVLAAMTLLGSFVAFGSPESIPAERIAEIKQQLRQGECTAVRKAVTALETLVIGGVGTLRYLAQGLENAIPNRDIVVMLLGVGSAIIDNVPLVAASMGMYTEGLDARLWHFVAYAAGTGGSMLVIGSAAGVAAMGMEKIDFIWYLRKVSWLAAIGFLSGGLAFVALVSS